MPKFNVVFEDDAKFDIAESFDWYSKISETVSNNFLNELKKVTEYLEINPLQFKLVFKSFRQVPIKRYPFVLLYKIDNQTVKIYRVFPTRKNPKTKFNNP